jgi:hypothetical protein
LEDDSLGDVDIIGDPLASKFFNHQNLMATSLLMHRNQSPPLSSRWDNLPSVTTPSTTANTTSTKPQKH